MRRLAVVLLFSSVLPAWGQKAGADWSRVKMLDPGTEIRVKSVGGPRVSCGVVRVDEDSIVCSIRHTILFFPITRQMAFQRARVREVRLTRPVLSSFGGAAIGAGVGVGLGYGLENDATRAEDPNVLPVTLGLLAAVAGEAVGHATDFLGGPTVYRVP